MPSTISQIMSRLQRSPELHRLGDAAAIIHFKLTGEQAGEWNAVLRDGKLEVAPGLPRSRPTLTIAADTSDLVSIAKGVSDATGAFMSGKIQITGDSALALRLMELISTL